VTNWATFIAGCISSLLVVSASMADSAPGGLPFDLYRGYIIVAEGEIGALGGLHFLIDTGTMPSIVDKQITHRLRLSGGAESVRLFGRNIKGQRVALPGLKFGPIQVESVPVLVRDLSSIEEALGARIDAVLGLDVLRSRSFSIDFTARRIHFAPESSALPSPTINSPLGGMVVEAERQGHPLHLLVDTGARDLILFKKHIQGCSPKLQVIGELNISKLGGKVRLQQVVLPPIYLGDQELANPRAFLMDAPTDEPFGIDGLLGVASLGVRSLSFDFERHRMTWVH